MTPLISRLQVPIVKYPWIIYTYLKGLWLFVIFGEHQVMAQLIATRVLISPLITKDFQFATFSSLVAILLP